MRADIYWIPQTSNGRLAIMPRPRAGDWLDDELNAWRDGGIDVVVSLLTPAEIIELGLQDESYLCAKNKMSYLSYPILDRQVPTSTKATSDLVQTIENSLEAGKGIAVHCRMGVGRSGLITACILVKQGLRVEAAFDTIGRARRLTVPDTEEQVKWVAFWHSNTHSQF